MKIQSTGIFALLVFAFFISSSYANFSVPDLSITKTADVTSVRPGDVFTYTLYVINQSVFYAGDVRVIDQLPSGLIFKSWSVIPPIVYPPDPYMPPLPRLYYVDDGIWITERMYDYDQFWLDITVQVDPLYSLDTIVNTALVSTINPESNKSNNESTLVLPVIHPVIPAPGVIMLGSIGLGVVGWLRRRRTL